MIKDYPQPPRFTALEQVARCRHPAWCQTIHQNETNYFNLENRLARPLEVLARPLQAGSAAGLRGPPQEVDILARPLEVLARPLQAGSAAGLRGPPQEVDILARPLQAGSAAGLRGPPQENVEPSGWKYRGQGHRAPQARGAVRIPLPPPVRSARSYSNIFT